MNSHEHNQRHLPGMAGGISTGSELEAMPGAAAGSAKGAKAAMIKGATALAIAALLGFVSAAQALDLTGPSNTLPGGGSCTVSGDLGSKTGATWSCTITSPGSFADVYFGMANAASVNGNAMDGSGPSGFEVLRYSGHTSSSIVYTSSTTLHNELGSATQAVNTRVVLTLASGTGTVVDTAGNPANNGNGDVDKLFRITSSSFSVHADVTSNTPPIPIFGESSPNVYDPTHTPASGTRNNTRVYLAFYYNGCTQ
jgi:hypothetical protein